MFVHNDNINEFCLNNSKLHLNKKETQPLAANILSAVDNIWYAETRNIGSDITTNLAALHFKADLQH